MFEKLICSAAASFDLEAAGPVLIASGQNSKTDPTLPDTSFMSGICGKNHDEVSYVIPGSTIKGVLRHYIENNMLKNAEEVNSIFGYIQNKVMQKSKIKFTDAYAEPDSIVISVRHSTAIEPMLQTAKHESLNNMGVVEKGVFHAGFIFRNYTEKEMETVLKALFDINSGIVRFGGRKSRGFGQMKVTNFSMKTNRGFDASLCPADEKIFTDIEAAILYFRGVKEE